MVQFTNGTGSATGGNGTVQHPSYRLVGLSPEAGGEHGDIADVSPTRSFIVVERKHYGTWSTVILYHNRECKHRQ